MNNKEKSSPENIAKLINEYMGMECFDEESTEEDMDHAGLDSLDHIEILMYLEEVFEIEIDDEEALGWKTVSGISQKIREKLS